MIFFKLSEDVHNILNWNHEKLKHTVTIKIC